MLQRAPFVRPGIAPVLLLAGLASCGTGTEAQEPQGDAGFLRVEAPEAAVEGASEGETTSEKEAASGETTVADAPEVSKEARDEPVATSAVPVAPSTAAPTGAASPATPASAPSASAPPVDETPEQRAAARLASGDAAGAARAYSDLLLAQLDAGGEDRETLSRLAAELARAQAAHRWNARGKWRSFDMVVRPGDSLIAIRKRALLEHPEILLCTGMIERANQLASSTAIRPDDVLRIPTDRPSVLVDLSARWAFYRLGDEVAAAWEVGTGRAGQETPTGIYTIGLKQEEPMWSPVGREPVPFGDPQNPLGTRWLEWNRDGARTSIGFHGTNDASTVGQPVSEGCIRMRNADVEALFEVAPIGAEVRVQP